MIEEFRINHRIRRLQSRMRKIEIELGLKIEAAREARNYELEKELIGELFLERDLVEDEIMKISMNHPMGPLALADLIGLDVCLHIMEVLHNDLGEDRYRPCPLLRRMVQAGRMGRKSKQGFFTYE